MSERIKDRHAASAMKQALTFVILTGALSALLWFGWSQINHHNFPSAMPSLDMGPSTTVGIHGTGPSSLDTRNTHDRTDPTTPEDPDSTALRQALVSNVYETLLSRDEYNRPVSGLAKSWSISKDALKYTFKLNTEMRFSNGDALDSSDVVYSIQQQINSFGAASNANGLVNLQTVSNPAPSTVVITLSQPNPRLLYALSTSSGIVYDSETGTNYAKKALGSGPFTVRDFQPRSSITLTRNSLYWGQQPASQQVTLRYYDNIDSLRKALHEDQIQFAVLKPGDSPKPFQLDKSLKVSLGKSTSKLLIALNNDGRSIFSDARARQSLRYIVDTKTLVQSNPEADEVLGGPIGPMEPGYEDLSGLFPHDLAKGSQDIDFFSPGYVGTPKFIVPQRYSALGQQLARQINQSHLQVTLETLDDGEFANRLRDGDYSLALTEMDQTGDAGSFANSAFGYQNGDVQRLYKAAQQARSDESYRTGMQTFARAVSQDSACCWLYTEHSIVVSTAKTHGYPTNLVNQRLPLENLTTT